MLILPHVLNDIIWRFAFAQSFYTGFKEVCMLVEFRSCVPHAFCGKSTLHHETQVFVLNPYCPGTPYLPLDSVYYHPFSPLRDWIARKVPVRYIRSVLRTYPKVMRRYAFSQDMAHEAEEAAPGAHAALLVRNAQILRGRRDAEGR